MIGKRQIISGEMHYPRIPHEYWRHRFGMARAMGLNTISTYVFWNVHEEQPGRFDFSGGKDVAGYVRIAAECGLDVVLRPGPYVCAEWEFGGLPAWLLAGDIRVRTTDQNFMRPARRWLRRIGDELAPLLQPYGGPIVAVQLENEYGAFGDDAAYLRALRGAYDDAGFGAVPYYTIDQPTDALRGSLPDLAIGLTFGPGDPRKHFDLLRKSRPDAPLICGEYWAGWFDHWGEPHRHDDAAQQSRDLAWMLEAGVNLNIYMFHGGTNFGFSNGANSERTRPYQPTVTSYDYLAAVDEAGRATPKYYAFRAVIAAHTRQALPEIPAPPFPLVPSPELEFRESAPLTEALGKPLSSATPVPMESLGQSFGYVLYRTHLHGDRSGELRIEEVRDYAVVSIDGRVAARLDRRLAQSTLRIDHAPDAALLEILVENGGRINYGPDFPFERKGITRDVYWNEKPLAEWTIWPLELRTLPQLDFTQRYHAGPAFFRGIFELRELADTFIEVKGLGKGSLWINGHHAGRFWEIGPQRALYIPAPWLRRGVNEVIAFDMIASQPRQGKLA
jgi:beta-galactosidase